ncbi:MAG: antibiotic biosynthesis monooxygenase [Deltaproteobacteria bacterium]|nr:antibiotic biosynthesis monooxygenase [Deltaproteobacteria bacterium]
MASPTFVTKGTTPVTVIVTRSIRAGREAEYETWLRGVFEVSRTFPGHLGIDVLRPAPGDREWTLIFRYDSPEHLKAWIDSDARKDWLARVEPLTDGHVNVKTLSGLEAWFSIPGRALATPPRYKMALLTWLVVYPLVVALGAGLAPLVGGLPRPVQALVSTAMMVPLMTWVVMPWVTRIFRPWLFR